MDVVSCRLGNCPCWHLWPHIRPHINASTGGEFVKGAQRLADGDLGHAIFIRGNDELTETREEFQSNVTGLAVYAGELETAKESAGHRDRAESVFTRWYSKPVPGRNDRE